MCPYEKHNGKIYYEIHKDILRKYSGTGTRVIVTLGPTPYFKGLVPQSWSWD